MTIRTLEAWVLHKKWSGDSSARVRFLTRELGVIDCFYKGCRTLKKKALLNAFTPLWISVTERYNQYFIHTVECSSTTVQLTGNSLFAGLYINEILYYALTLNYSAPILFDAYSFTLNSLESINDRLALEALLRRFEWVLVRTCGYSFSLTHEAKTGNLISADLFYQFVAGEGLVRDSKGIPGSHILALADDDLSNEAYLKSAKMMMRQAVDHLVGGRMIKSRALYFVATK